MLKPGRPTDYSQELGDVICAKIAEGMSVRNICLEEDMPCTTTFYRWMRLHKEFREQYAKAKDDQADALVEEILDIADDGTNDWIENYDREGNSTGWKENKEAINRSRLRVDTRKWLASKLKAKKYGDSTILRGDPEQPLVIDDRTKKVLSLLTEEQLTQLNDT